MIEATVIIPVYNQAFPLVLTLQGYMKQEKVEEVEIIVIDRNSIEPIEAIVESYRDQLRVKYIRSASKECAVARNIGAIEAQGEILIFSEAERIPYPRFVYEHILAQRKARGAFVIGHDREMLRTGAIPNRPLIMETYLHRSKTKVQDHGRAVYSLFSGNGASSTQIPWVSALSGSFSIPLEAFDVLGGFDENFFDCGFEFLELAYRAYVDKIPFYYASKAINVQAFSRRRFDDKEQIRRSHRYFFTKHRKFVVKKLLDFMLGEISMAQLEQAADSYLIIKTERSHED